MAETQPLRRTPQMRVESATADYFPGEEDYVYTRIQKQRRMKRCVAILLGVGALSLLIASVTILIILLLRVGGQSPRVTVACGILEGDFDISQNVYSFKGVPFAKPPVGDLRWKVPQEMKQSDGSCWSDVRPAVTYANQCAQKDPGTKKFTGNEDCLYLDIFSPSIEEDAMLPVMVYIHGGYLRYGNGTGKGYAPTVDITKKLGVVFVSIQYRLNAMGFLVLDELPDAKGNLAIRDQILALEWIKANIKRFGGNPQDVTIFGASSGGSSVLLLMVSPLANGLFHKAWSMSASSYINHTIEEAREQNRFFVNKTNCFNESAEIVSKCLYRLSSRSVVEAIYPEWTYDDAVNLPTKGLFEMTLPVVDGEVLIKGLRESFEEGVKGMSDVPLMIGTTAQEVDLFPDPLPGLTTMIDWKTNQNLYNEYIRLYLDPFGGNITEQAMAYYPYKLHDTPLPELSFTSMTSDVKVNCPNDEIAAAASKTVKSVYRYVVIHRPTSPVSAFDVPFPANYSLHGWDTFAFFDAIDIWMSKRPQTSDLAFASNLQEEMMSFVRTGEPASDTWQTYPGNTALLNTTSTFVQRYNKQMCEWWMDKGFFKYAWMN